MPLTPTILTGQHVQLEPFEERHREELRPAAQDERIWTVTTSAFGEKFDPYFDTALARIRNGTELGFTVRQRATGKLVGGTRFMAIEEAHKRLEIGTTWYHPSVWASVVNPECKLLLMQHAFEVLRFNRVEFKTDARNARSRAAILKLGARQEGIFRKHMVLPDGHIRDSVWFSVTDDDWPAVKEGLLRRIAAG
jgi:RimJ/RimL family protein N-acetyltransferase